MKIGQKHGAAVVHVLGGFDAHRGCGGHPGDGRHLWKLLRDPYGYRNVVIRSYSPEIIIKLFIA